MTPAAPLILTVLLAVGLWFVAFRLPWSNFWLKISFSAALLAALSMRLQAGLKDRLALNGRAVWLGLASAAVLYSIFWLGRFVSSLIFPFAAGQIGGIYGLGEGTPAWVSGLLLILVTGPSEELYWRGYLQRQLMLRLGEARGFLLATALYAGVHLWTLNFMLVGAAAVAGAFWGLMYWRWRNLPAQIISHSIWSAVIFSLAPMH